MSQTIIIRMANQQVSPMSSTRYPGWTRHLHWLAFALVASALTLIYIHHWTPRGTVVHARAKWAHIQFGIAILLVMLPRITSRRRSASPPVVPPLARWQAVTARAMQLALYALLIATPVLGVANRMWDTGTWDFLGIPLPHVAKPDKAFARMLESIHGTFGNLLMYLAILHAAAALFHHYVRRDNVLMRMLPWALAARGKPSRAAKPDAP